jgi:hypothetical protein
MDKRDYHTHVMVLAWINIGFSALFAFIGLFALFFLTGLGLAAEDAEAARILGFIGSGALVFFGALALPGFAAGYGLLKRRVWGRVLGIIVAVLDLFNIPIGTAVGLYGLWVLTYPEAADYFTPATESPVPSPGPGAGQTPA